MFTTRAHRCRFSLYEDHVIAHPVLVVLVFFIADHHHLWTSHIVGHVQTSSFDAVLCTVSVQHRQFPEKVCPPLLPLLHSLQPSASSTFCGRMGGEVDGRSGAQVQPQGGRGWGHGRSASELAAQLRKALEPRARPRGRRRLRDEADARMGRVEGVAATTASMAAMQVWMRRCWAVVDARWQVVTDDEGLSPGPYKYLRSFSSDEDAGEGISVSSPDVPTKMVSKIHKTAKIVKWR
uniref:Uncharacterized protein n=1 Tax=Oryza meridionalis TaxID=40149 RepID=A0A0E0E0E7_9ORYZ